MKDAAPGQGQQNGGDPPGLNGASFVPTDVDSSRLTLDKVPDILGWTDQEYTAVCHRPVGGTFSSSVVKSVDAITQVKSLPDTVCSWFSVNPTAGPARVCAGRGNERQVTRWAALYLDLDVKEGAFPDLDKAAEFVSVVSEMVGTRPSLIIFSGHGLQPVWPIEDGELDDDVKWSRAYRLSRRFGRMAARAAASHSGAALDNVSDLTRVLRLPGTTNWKDPEHPAEAFAVLDVGGPLTVDGIEEFLDEWAATEIASDHPAFEQILSFPENWEFGEADCRYVIGMVGSWDQESDRPTAGRHQCAMSRCVRLAAAHRLGCITEDGLNAALEHLEKALARWCQEVGEARPLHHDEIGSAFRWAQAKMSTFTSLRAQSELGNHKHGSAPPEDLGAKVTGDGQRPRHLRERLLGLSELRNLPPAEPLIEGLLYRNTLAQLSGAPGCYKSFAAIAMSCALAAGKPFGDFPVPCAGTVLYVAAEGANGLATRVLAWCETWGVDVALVQERLRFLNLPLALGDEAVVAEAVDLVVEMRADLVILDTRARCTIGLEENSATQQGLAIDAADRIRAAADCTVLGIHHSSRTGTAGRGSNAWDGAVWSDLRMEGGGLQATINCQKHKDVPAGCSHHFALIEHTVSYELMPEAFGPRRSTLVISNAASGLPPLRVNSQRVVSEIIWNSAPPEGLTASELVDMAAPLRVGKSSVYRLFDFDRAISMMSGLRPAVCGCSGIVSGGLSSRGFGIHMRRV
jgi:hypothetical protein